jgi:hypothetical protein
MKSKLTLSTPLNFVSPPISSAQFRQPHYQQIWRSRQDQIRRQYPVAGLNFFTTASGADVSVVRVNYRSGAEYLRAGGLADELTSTKTPTK